MPRSWRALSDTRTGATTPLQRSMAAFRCRGLLTPYDPHRQLNERGFSSSITIKRLQGRTHHPLPSTPKVAGGGTRPDNHQGGGLQNVLAVLHNPTRPFTRNKLSTSISTC